MKYKGQHIDDTKDVKRYERVDKFTYDYSNGIELGIEELDELKEIIRKKESELKEKGVRFSDVKIEMLGIDAQYNPNGADLEASFETEISWSEPESDEESKKRIEKTKSRIDQGIEIERKKKEDEERQKRKSLEQAIQLVEQSGFKVLQ